MTPPSSVSRIPVMTDDEQGLGAPSGTGSHASHEAPTGLRPTGFDPSRIASIAAKLTPAQAEAILAIRPGEERRAIDFNANSANSLAATSRAGGPLLTRTLTANGQVCWYRHTRLGDQVRSALKEQRKC